MVAGDAEDDVAQAVAAVADGGVEGLDGLALGARVLGVAGLVRGLEVGEDERRPGVEGATRPPDAVAQDGGRVGVVLGGWVEGHPEDPGEAGEEG